MSVAWSAVVIIIYEIAAVAIIFALVRRGWPRWLTLPLFSTHSLHPAPEGSKKLYFPAFELHTPSRLYEASTGHSVHLLVYRIFMLAMFAFGMLYQGLAPNRLASGWEWSYLSAFTDWNYLAFGLYSIIGIVVSSRGLWRPRPDAIGYNWLDKIYAVFFATLPATALVVVCAYWPFVHTDPKVLLESVWKHGVNAALLLGELLLARAPITSTWLMFPPIWTLTYAIFMWIYWAIEDIWEYPRLDFTEVNSLKFYAGLPFFVIFAFWLIFVIVWAREALVKHSCFGVHKAQSADRDSSSVRIEMSERSASSNC